MTTQADQIARLRDIASSAHEIVVRKDLVAAIAIIDQLQGEVERAWSYASQILKGAVVDARPFDSPDVFGVLTQLEVVIAQLREREKDRDLITRTNEHFRQEMNLLDSRIARKDKLLAMAGKDLNKVYRRILDLATIKNGQFGSDINQIGKSLAEVIAALQDGAKEK